MAQENTQPTLTEATMLTQKKMGTAPSNRKPAIRLLLYSVAFIALAMIYYHIFGQFPRNSDDASTYLSGYDMSKGNWNLAGWWSTDDNFLTMDVPFYAVLIKCLGFNLHILLYLPAILWATLALLSVYLAEIGLARSDKPSALAAVATPVLFPILDGNGRMYFMTHAPMHITTIIYVLIIFILAKRALSQSSGRPILLLTGYTLLICITLFGDPLAIFIGALPVCLVSGYSVIRNGARLSRLFLLTFTIIAIVATRALLFLFSWTGGFEIAIPQQMRLAPISDLGKNLGMVAHFFFVLFGCDFFGKDLPTSLMNGPILALIRLPFLGLVVFALVHMGRKFLLSVQTKDARWPVTESDYLDALLALGFSLCVLATALSTRITDDGAVRFLFPALVFGAILIGRVQTANRIRYLYVCFALIASITFYALDIATNPRKTVLAKPNINLISDWLSKNNLHDGFGPYWSSSIVTVATKNRVRVRPLALDPHGVIRPYQWNGSKNWYLRGIVNKTRPVFVLVDNADTHFYSEQDLIRTAGEPLERRQVGQYTVNFYNPESDRLDSFFLDSVSVP
jgi:hypothetical protein